MTAADRPSPHALWTQANGDRVEYLRLLREHGHVIVGKRPDGEDIFGHPVTPEERHAWRPDYGPVETPGVAPGRDHPIWTLDVRTLDYVIESLVGIWSAEPDLLIESAISDVRAIRGFSASDRPHEPGEPHRYRIDCTICGQPGTVRVSVEPQRKAAEEEVPA